jgi:hypothetical protein
MYVQFSATQDGDGAGVQQRTGHFSGNYPAGMTEDHDKKNGGTMKAKFEISNNFSPLLVVPVTYAVTDSSTSSPVWATEWVNHG